MHNTTQQFKQTFHNSNYSLMIHLVFPFLFSLRSINIITPSASTGQFKPSKIPTVKIFPSGAFCQIPRI